MRNVRRVCCYRRHSRAGHSRQSHRLKSEVTARKSSRFILRTICAHLPFRASAVRYIGTFIRAYRGFHVVGDLDIAVAMTKTYRARHAPGEPVPALDDIGADRFQHCSRLRRSRPRRNSLGIRAARLSDPTISKPAPLLGRHCLTMSRQAMRRCEEGRPAAAGPAIGAFRREKCIVRRDAHIFVPPCDVCPLVMLGSIARVTGRARFYQGLNALQRDCE